MTEALISICVPTYQGEKYVKQTIQSVLDQTYQNFEIIISDDGSSDKTEEICRHFDDPRITFVKHETNLGPKGNWNSCLLMINGEYYKLLPQDDILTPTCLSEQVHILETMPNIALTFGSRTIINGLGQTIMRRAPLGKSPRKIDGYKLVRQCLKSGGNIIGEPGNGLIRTSHVRKVGDYDDIHPYTIDLDYWFRILAEGDAYYTAKPTSAFRVHNNSWSAEIGQKQHRDFVGTISKFAKNPAYGIGHYVKLMGRSRSWLNMNIRRLIFRNTNSG